MGCVHGKCCSRYPSSSDGDSRHQHEVGHLGSKHILTQRSLEIVPVPSHNFKLQYSVLTQRGYYPDSPDKENQDSFCIKTQIQGNPNIHFFGVFDGHGLYGAECSNFVKDRLVEILANDPMLLNDPVKAYSSAFLRTNSELHSSKIDDSMSGTTSITVLVIGDKIYVANVGDSRAVIGVKNGNRIVAEDLSNDQTPFRKDEYERVKLCGARVLSVDQVEGYKDPNIQTWDDEESQGGDPPRLWVPNGMYPGTAFTRSVGDSTAETIGVIADPEVSVVQLMPNHLFFVVASDGVFEFLSSQTVVDMVARYADPRDACAAIAGESYKLWLEHENRTDDITIIIVHIKESSNPATGAMDGTAEVNRNQASSRARKETSDFSSASGSEIYRSMRSEFSDPQLTVIRSAAIVVPSPSHQRHMELDGG
ncbi:probable protein phosphatase 2C 35 [Ricinus communis]|uniref:probable protein phosphatase 2C 35 n=1 Tax=Ricinus communis TaxID=3988 RepID=UPI000772C57D|nr:probable protein phosphatase 2C 35 [Ricinus communis]XP_048235194.1 probable protein phosphatase 2C 35 [Ricinus communis]|eukprot:XP_002516819.2 probable protein phosphatase 2C 35 [Ricinus communis]